MSKLRPAVSENDHQTGNPSSATTLVEFGDYQCPHCGHAYPLLKKLIKETDIHFVFRNFPLQEVHPAAMMAARAAEAAALQDKFWEMHDLIFEHQSTMNGSIFLQFAEELKLDMQKFAEDWKSEAVGVRVELDFESGLKSGVNGTPGFFINGHKLDSYDGTYESLLSAVQAPASAHH
jgi:protein-disulfide isomerase